jgi:hypothetical protein
MLREQLAVAPEIPVMRHDDEGFVLAEDGQELIRGRIRQHIPTEHNLMSTSLQHARGIGGYVLIDQEPDPMKRVRAHQAASGTVVPRVATTRSFIRRVGY